MSEVYRKILEIIREEMCESEDYRIDPDATFEDMDIEEALQMKRELDEEMFVACNRIDTSYQYHHKTNA